MSKIEGAGIRGYRHRSERRTGNKSPRFGLHAFRAAGLAVALLCTAVADGHWIQTHLEVTVRARDLLVADLASGVPTVPDQVSLLDASADSSGKTYIEFLLDGVRDADLRANGLYAVDDHCSEYWVPLEQCAPGSLVSNNIPDWPVGDHGFAVAGRNYGAGHYAGRYNWVLESGGAVTRDGSTWSQVEERAHGGDPEILELLRAVAPGRPLAEQLAGLRGSLQESNAASMAAEFYGRALDAWAAGRRVDAFYNLGIALHLIQDMTVPTHVRIGEVLDFDDTAYERYAWEIALQEGAASIPVPADYQGQDAWSWAVANARRTYETFSTADPASSAVASIQLAVSSTAGAVASFFRNGRNGVLRWRQRLPASDVGTPAVGPDGTVYAATDLDGFGNLHAFTPAGSRKWQYPAEDLMGVWQAAFTLPALDSQGNTHLGASYEILSVGPTGFANWEAPLQGYQYNPRLALGSDGTVYATHTAYEQGVGEIGRLRALEPNGVQKWVFTGPVGSSLITSPSVDAEGTIYFGKDNWFFAINPDGTEKWSFYPTVGDTRGAPAIGSDGTVYIGTDTSLYAFHSGGTVRWAYLLGTPVRSAPVVGSDGTVYVGTDDGDLYAVGSDGSQHWVYQTGAPLRGSPAVGANGTVYVGSVDGRLHAVAPDGSHRWTLVSGLPLGFSPILAADGNLYVGTGGAPPWSWVGYLFAVETRSGGPAPSAWPLARHDAWNTGRAAVFGDVPHGHWAEAPIAAFAAAGITGGCGVGTFCPDTPVSRAQMAVFLEKAMRGGAFRPPLAVGDFGDVPPAHWAAGWIEQFARDGITGGCGGGNYCPDWAVTRAQMAVFLEKAMAWPSPASPAPGTGAMFADVPLAHWACAWVEQLAADGITGGCTTTNYCPENPVTRAQMAVFLVRAFGL